MSISLPYRQVHLDFHTSGHIPRVGERFDKRQFQDMLRLGHVNSVTLFSKCHHGYSYHDTVVGERHPHLVCDLLPLQMEACAEIGVQTPIYLSAGLDEVSINQHPEWGVRARDGKTFDPLRAGFKALCFGTPYLDYLCAQIEEAVTLFVGRTPGVFLDIIAARRCYCHWCLAGMKAAGYDPEDEEQVGAYAQTVLRRYFERATAASRVRDPNLRVFHNSGHVGKGDREGALRYNSHLELESLPTGGWGYDHFPVSARYAATTGLSFLGMTGKFHQTWGEFGGFKRPEALRYECSAMLAYGARCSVGDQLHPSGEMNPDTYRLIGAAYADVEAAEPWATGAQNVADIALVSPEALRRGGAGGHSQTSAAEEGAARMLLELHAAFDVVDLDADLSGYRVVILPDEFALQAGGQLAQRLAAFVAEGGRLLLSGKSGMNPDGTAFVPDLDLGLVIYGKGDLDPDYLVPADLAPTPPVRGPFVIHGGAWEVRPERGGWEVLAGRAVPYFNRTWDHFCSHQHTPEDPDAPDPSPGALLDTARGFAYFGHSLFTRYREYGQPLYRDLVKDALAALLPEPAFTAAFPSSGRTTLTRQPAQNRHILHLLYATPTKRGAAQSQWGTGTQSVEVIEDLVPLHDIACTVRVGEPVVSVTLEPQGEALPYTQEDAVVHFTVPRLLCHQMVTIATGQASDTGFAKDESDPPE